MDVDKAVERTRRFWIRRRPSDRHVDENAKAQRMALERIARGYTDTRQRDYYWTPGQARVEQTLLSPQPGEPVHMGKYFTDGASYCLSRDIGSATVDPGINIFDGSLAEGILFYGVKLKDVISPLTVKAIGEGSSQLTGRLHFGRGPAFFPDGSLVRITTSAERHYLPERLEVFIRGNLRETAVFGNPRGFGHLTYPERVDVRRFMNGIARYHWLINVENATLGSEVPDDDFVPRDSRPIWVADSRLPNQPATYTIPANKRFPTQSALPAFVAARENGPPTAASNLTLQMLRALALAVAVAGAILLMRRRGAKATQS